MFSPFSCRGLDLCEEKGNRDLAGGGSQAPTFKPSWSPGKPPSRGGNQSALGLGWHWATPSSRALACGGFPGHAGSKLEGCFNHFPV